ncbi:MAG: acireductone synthase [Microscillaceae bacterium]|nr:acireductone synthase [Microscillaceae bacterium]MDW8459811.1 acireductone synthase [Cytophagales bacterium]
MPIQYILTDIEGTTTSVSFVYEVLFPYFEKNLPKFLEQNQQNSLVQACLQEVQRTVEQEQNLTTNFRLEDALHTLLQWTRQDRKHTALKTLQGILWELGYQKGEIKGHIYEEVPTYLAQWHKAGIRLGIYSSGSVKAQKLLFGTSIFGDLTPYFSHYFDTNIGQKKASESYKNIQNILELPASQILFLSDVVAELDAAKLCGFQTIQLVRNGHIQANPKHPIATNFAEVNQIMLQM